MPREECDQSVALADLDMVEGDCGRLGDAPCGGRERSVRGRKIPDLGSERHFMAFEVRRAAEGMVGKPKDRSAVPRRPG